MILLSTPIEHHVLCCQDSAIQMGVLARHTFTHKGRIRKYDLYSRFRASEFYVEEIQQDATVCRYLFAAKITLHVSGVHCSHHQEYIKL